jgi:hypothetical protein
MYRLYISDKGRFRDRIMKENIEDVFKITDKSITETEEFTKYMAIENHNREHGDRILLFFINADLPYLGIDSYYEEKGRLLGGEVRKRR